MTRDFPSLEALEARCSEYAKPLLRELADHRHFPRLVAKLMEIEGTILRADIERALYEVNTEQSRDD